MGVPKAKRPGRVGNLDHSIVCGLAECDELVTPPQRAYCSAAHRRKVEERKRYRARVQRERLEGASVPPEKIAWLRQHLPHGPTYDEMLRRFDEVMAPVISGHMTHQVAAELMGTQQATFSRMLKQFTEDVKLAERAERWVADGRFLAMLLLDGAEAAYAEADEDGRTELVDAGVRAFLAFEAEFFTDERARPLIRRPAHLRWLRAFVRSLLSGGRNMVLAPPRHGKTQLLLNLIVWLVVSRPNIRIMWISAAEGLAKEWSAALRETFASHEGLRGAFLPPGSDFVPSYRSPRPWSNEMWTVDTRTIIGISAKSPTFQAIGAGGTIHSRDVDLLVVDDFEDLKRNLTEDQQEKNRRWFGQVAGARKEDHTAFFVIGSRTDPNDLYHLLEQSDEWETIVEQAHDLDCTLDPEDESLHIDCMMFPERRSYGWLMSRRREMEALGIGWLWDMQYQNRSTLPGIVPYDEDEMKACRNPHRDIGDWPANCLLIGGLDPAPVNTQAAFLWAWNSDTGQLLMVDMETVEFGGTQGVRWVVKDWFEKYGLRRWVIEETGWQKGIFRDEMLRDYCAANNILIEPHETQGINKWDPRWGVTAMGNLYSQMLAQFSEAGDLLEPIRKIDLPYGSLEARSKVDRLIGQAKRFSEARLRGRGRSGKSDILMAHWFPMKVIRQFEAETDEEGSVLEYEPVFAAVTEGFYSDVTEVPW